MASTIERILLTQDDSFMLRLFDQVGAREICLLGMTSVQMHCVVKRYFSCTWDVHHFLYPYISNTRVFLERLRVSKSVIFGIVPLKYFDRQKSTGDILDICITLSGAHIMRNALIREGYEYDGRFGEHQFVADLMTRFAQLPTEEMKINGDKNVFISDRSSSRFTFHKARFVNAGLRIRSTVNIYVVRCDPYVYVLNLHSTASMHFIDGVNAISLFPFATFVNRCSMVAREVDVRSDALHGSQKSRLDVYCERYGMIYFDETTETAASELGERYIGDRLSWVIPCDHTAPLVHTPGYMGAAFEVLGKSKCSPTSHLMIREPRHRTLWARYIRRRLNLNESLDQAE